MKQEIEDLRFLFPRIQRASLFIFESNDDVIKMTVKGRSPTMDWLFDRSNMDPGIQINYVKGGLLQLLDDTHTLATILRLFFRP